MIISGNTNANIVFDTLLISGTLTLFSLYNKNAGVTNCSVGIFIPETSIYLFYKALAATGTADSTMYQETKITVPAGANIFLDADDEVDYFFQID
jgi:hypothetical protein